MQLDSKRLPNSPLQIDTAPANHTVPLKVRTLLDPFHHFGLLFGRQAGQRPVAARQSEQTLRSQLVVAVHPVAQRLTVHRAGLGRSLARPAFQHQANRQHPTRRFRILRLCCQTAQLRRRHRQPCDRDCHRHPLRRVGTAKHALPRRADLH